MFSFFCSLDFQTSLLGLAPNPEERATAGQCPPRPGSQLHDTFLGAPRFSSLCSSSPRCHTCFLQWLPVCRLGDPLFTFAAIYLLCIQFPALNSVDSQPIPLFLTEPRPVLSCGFLLIINFDVFLKLFGGLSSGNKIQPLFSYYNWDNGRYQRHMRSYAKSLGTGLRLISIWPVIGIFF